MMNSKTTLSLNIGGRLKTWARPAVMGIVNLTSDSFYARSRYDEQDVCDKVSEMLADGADMIDLGACSTRPGAEPVSADTEINRLLPAISSLRAQFPELIISIDTYRAAVARKCIEAGADIINDIGGGTLDAAMFETVARLKVPYILMHMRGTPATMQSDTDYGDVTAEILTDLAFKADRLHQLGVCDVIIDPGFGFAKTTEQNFEILGQLEVFTTLGPVLAGLSRKSMITKTLDIPTDEALNGTTALNMTALINGASILRVHDVREAVQTVRLYQKLMDCQKPTRSVITTTLSNHITKTRIY